MRWSYLTKLLYTPKQPSSPGCPLVRALVHSLERTSRRTRAAFGHLYYFQLSFNFIPSEHPLWGIFESYDILWWYQWWIMNDRMIEYYDILWWYLTISIFGKLTIEGNGLRTVIEPVRVFGEDVVFSFFSRVFRLFVERSLTQIDSLYTLAVYIFEFCFSRWTGFFAVDSKRHGTIFALYLLIQTVTHSYAFRSKSPTPLQRMYAWNKFPGIAPLIRHDMLMIGSFSLTMAPKMEYASITSRGTPYRIKLALPIQGIWRRSFSVCWTS